jgi:mono/diheme cytochrome c family protein
MLKGALLATIILALAAAGGALAFVKVTGLSARATPGPIERTVSRRLRAWAVPAAYRARTNPIPMDEDSVRSGMAHFADHCASCHANDGSGDTELGKALFPPAPDMRAPGTQSLSDAELFYAIEHGVRFTGMPAWGTGTAAGEADSWRLVNFIRHLPRITEAETDEMAGMNPRSPAEVRADIEAERFLAGEDVSPSASGAGR